MNQSKNKLAEEELKFLASYRLKLKQVTNPKIRKELESDFLRLVGENNLQNKPVRKPSILFHRPVDTVKFLSLLKDEYGFKFLTHDWKTPSRKFTYDSVLKEAKEQFIEYTSNPDLKIQRSIYSLLRGYIFGEYNNEPLTWLSLDEKKIDWSWSDKRVENWCKNNAPHHPIEDNIDGLKDNLIIPFKDVIELRNDGSFTQMIQKLLKKNGILKTSGWEIKFEGLDKIRAYTNVYVIKSGLDLVFRAVQERTNTIDKKKLTIELNRSRNLDRRTFDLIITHHNSKPNINANPNDFLKNDMRSVWVKFFGLVDWKIEADFDDGSKRLNLLAEGVRSSIEGNIEKSTPTPLFNNNNLIELLGEAANGFRHIITFYQ